MILAIESLVTDIQTTNFTTFGKPDGYLDTILLSSKEASKRLGVTDAHVRRIRAELSNDAYAYYGSDIFDLIDSGDSLAVMNRIKNISSDSATNVIPKEVLDRMPRVGGSGVNIRDCVDEIQFLRQHSLATIDSERSKLDNSHLAKLYDILMGKPSRDKDELLRVLSVKK
jgi:hypothetical protein